MFSDCGVFNFAIVLRSNRSLHTVLQKNSLERMEPFKRKEANDTITKELSSREKKDPSCSSSTSRTNEDGCDDPHINTAREYIRYLNFDPEGLRKVCHPSFQIVFKTEGGAKVTLDEIIYETRKIRRSFPDIRFIADHYMSMPDGRLKLELRVVGTHTGAPYGFGPFSPIPPAGTKVQNGPETLTFKFDEKYNMIREVSIPVTETYSGPPGLYAQIGGRMDF